MMRLDAVVLLFADLDAAELAGWIAQGWVRPEQAGDEPIFQDIDIARVRLVYDLRRAMAIAEDMMPLVLSLLDQVYELRGELAAISSALKAQPADVRDAVLAALERRTG